MLNAYYMPGTTVLSWDIVQQCTKQTNSQSSVEQTRGGGQGAENLMPQGHSDKVFIASNTVGSAVEEGRYF